jgi:hypothetical protein
LPYTPNESQLNKDYLTLKDIVNIWRKAGKNVDRFCKLLKHDENSNKNGTCKLLKFRRLREKMKLKKPNEL